MEEATWYLGPLGDLRALDCPEPGIKMDQVRYGAVHQGLSGARTMDVTGTRMQYEFQFDYLEKDEWAWFNALNTRMVPGPFYLIDPMKKNRLSVQACRMTRPLTEYPSMSYELSHDHPSAIDLPIRSMRIKSWTDYNVSIPIRWERGYFTPVFPQETVTASVYAKASAAASGRLYFDYVDAAGQQVSQYFETKSLTTNWQRISMTRTVPAGVAGLRFYYQTLSPRTELFFAAPQLENGSVLTDWEIGGGGNTVLIDAMPTTSPRFPLRSFSLSLLEA